jgi:hypothetical protein
MKPFVPSVALVLLITGCATRQPVVHPSHAPTRLQTAVDGSKRLELMMTPAQVSILLGAPTTTAAQMDAPSPWLRWNYTFGNGSATPDQLQLRFTLDLRNTNAPAWKLAAWEWNQ